MYRNTGFYTTFPERFGTGIRRGYDTGSDYQGRGEGKSWFQNGGRGDG
jgi:hypothetical protein